MNMRRNTSTKHLHVPLTTLIPQLFKYNIVQSSNVLVTTPYFSGVLKMAIELPTASHKSTIELFPTELLLIIFKYLYLSITRPCDKVCHICARRPHRIWPEEQQLKPDTIFPQDVARVCRHWRLTLLCEPEFWGRVVVFVDSNLPDVKAHLEWSYPLPVDVIIQRREKRRCISMDMEKRRVDSIMKVIGPAFGRVHRLEIRHVHRDNVIEVMDCVGETSEMLETLILKPEESTISEEDIVTQKQSSKSFYFPNLSRLVMDGYNFNILNKHGEGLVKVCPRLDYLTIRGGDFTAYGAVDPLQALRGLNLERFLHLKRVNLPVNETPAHTIGLPVENVRLAELNASSINTFFRQTNLFQLNHLELFHCSMDANQELPDCWSIAYNNLSSEMRTSHLAFGNLFSWRGTNLTFTNHNGFNDDFLEKLGTHTRDGFPCSNLRRLSVVHCDCYSMEALKKMIRARRRLVILENGPYVDASIDFLVIVQKYLDVKDEGWLRANVREFHWYES